MQDNCPVGSQMLCLYVCMSVCMMDDSCTLDAECTKVTSGALRGKLCVCVDRFSCMMCAQWLGCMACLHTVNDSDCIPAPAIALLNELWFCFAASRNPAVMLGGGSSPWCELFICLENSTALLGVVSDLPAVFAGCVGERPHLTRHSRLFQTKIRVPKSGWRKYSGAT